MAHVNRARRSANERRRKIAEAKQKPLPMKEQLRRAAERAELHALTYATAPEYGGGYSPRPRTIRQRAAELPFWLNIMALHVQRGMRKAAEKVRGRKAA